MNLGLEGKRALVLGSSRGLGAAIAAGLAREGVDVLAASRTAADVKAWAARLGEAGTRVKPVHLDLADFRSVESMIVDVMAGGGVDILVNNSGGPAPMEAQEARRSDWLQQFETMAANIFHITGAFLPGMKERGFGRIVTVASSGIEQPIPRLALSNGIRSAILGWSKTLAGEVAKYGITVNMVIPGRIATDRVAQLDQANAARSNRDIEAVRQAALAEIPTGRYGTPEEFANVAVFLASERASYVTGSMFRIDGGAVRGV